MAQRQRVFLDISIGAQPAGRLTIELFSDKAPKTCENFRTLCIGSQPPLTYKMAKFHRVIDEFMAQGGDITKGDGSGGTSIYGATFEDENLEWRDMDAAGLVCMANRGKDTNSSQFFITLAPCDHLNGKHTVFGRLVSGQETLERMSKVDVDDDDCPKEAVIITHCGELERRKKTLQPPSSAVETPATSGDERGRKRRHASRSRGGGEAVRSGSRDKRSSRTPSASPRPPQKRDRRRSDAEIDEGLRGRVRKRSPGRPARSPPAPITEGTEPTRSDRRRGDSPSRNPEEKQYSRSPDYRNRRSLPNHHERRQENYSLRDDGYRGGGGYGRRGGGGGDQGYGGHYRGARNNNRYAGGGSSGRLGGGDFEDDAGGEVKLKGRGMMKYRER